MAFQSITRAIANTGSFAVPAITAGASGQVIVHNNTKSGLMGSMRIVRTADSVDETFQLDLEPGQAYVFRNATAATVYTYTGTFKHTAVSAATAFEYDRGTDDAYDATGQASAFHLPAITVQQI